MKLGTLRRIAALGSRGIHSSALVAAPALAQAPRRRAHPEQGRHRLDADGSALVLLMTVPGLALFYGGLVRTKNMLSMLMQVFFIVASSASSGCSTATAWPSPRAARFNAFVGGFSKAFLAGVTPDSNAETFTDGVVIPEYVYICFQMTFAASRRR